MDCIFCGIANKSVPTQLVHEDERVVAFRDLNPQAPTHLLIIPKAHYASIQDVPPEDLGIVGELVAVAQDLARERGIWPSGYRLVVNTGPQGGQTVGHLHVHLLAGRQMMWPPG
ncbi:MAG: histidine triad nucleotide-binding protein [Thermaerobacter sp.]|nr:histidine triad nucleotide-binding protein [Thermaerobacter sp.]